MRVVLADGSDERAKVAARLLDREGLAAPVVLDDPASFCSRALQTEAETSPWSERIRAGVWLNVIGLVLIVFWVYVAGGLIGI